MYFAALPPDVRKVADLPLCLTSGWGSAPEELDVAQILELGQAESPSLSAHRAARPPAQARSSLLKDVLPTRKIRCGICENAALRNVHFLARTVDGVNKQRTSD